MFSLYGRWQPGVNGVIGLANYRGDCSIQRIGGECRLAGGPFKMSTLRRVVTIAATAGLLFGCATAAQQQLQSMAAGTRVAAQSVEGCVAAIYNQPELEPLRRDLPLNVKNASLEQLSNQNSVSEVEIRLILANHPKLQTCRKQFVDQISQTMPTVAPIMVRTSTTEDNYLIDLLQKKLRWGEFLQRVRTALNERDAEIAAEGKRIMAGLQLSHDAELQRRQAAVQAIGQALQEYGRAQQAISAMRVNCTTMEIRPGFSTTNCY